MSLKWKEPLFVVGFMGLMVAPWFIYGLTLWGWFFVGVCILLGIFELYSLYKTKKTLSQQFWKFSKENKSKAIIIISAITLGWIFLIWHLIVKMI